MHESLKYEQNHFRYLFDLHLVRPARLLLHISGVQENGLSWDSGRCQLPGRVQ